MLRKNERINLENLRQAAVKIEQNKAYNRSIQEMIDELEPVKKEKASTTRRESRRTERRSDKRDSLFVKTQANQVETRRASSFMNKLIPSLKVKRTENRKINTEKKSNKSKFLKQLQKKKAKGLLRMNRAKSQEYLPNDYQIIDQSKGKALKCLYDKALRESKGFSMEKDLKYYVDKYGDDEQLNYPSYFKKFAFN